MNKLLITAAGLIASTLIGCGSSGTSSGGPSGVVLPSGGKPAESPRAATSNDDQVLAEIEGLKLTESQFKPILYKSRGLDVLLMVIQRDLARADAEKNKVTISPADIDEERKITLVSAFPDAKEEDYDQALKQLLTQQRVSDTEFTILMEYNAYLRAIVKRSASTGVTDEAVLNEFNSLYGERIEVRDIALNNMQEVADAKALLEDPTAPIPFEEVARRKSRLPGIDKAGLLPPFARTSPGYNPVFTAAAFAMQPGQVSTDLIQDKGFYHILKVERRIAPIAVKFEDVKASVREELVRRRAAALMSAKRQELGQLALRELHILEPSMKAEFDAKIAAANPKPVDKEKLIKELEDSQKERERAATQATQASPQPTPAVVPPAPSAPQPNAPVPQAEPTTVPASQP